LPAGKGGLCVLIAAVKTGQNRWHCIYLHGRARSPWDRGVRMAL